MRVLSLIILLFFASGVCSSSSAIAATKITATKKVAIIASTDVDKLSLEQLKNIYSLKQKLLPNDAQVKLIQLPLNSKTTQEFTRQLFELYPYQVQRLWDRLVFSGRARAPLIMDSESKVFAHLSTSSSTIAYVSANSSLFVEYKGKVNVIATF